jgi:hypothetical protein
MGQSPSREENICSALSRNSLFTDFNFFYFLFFIFYFFPPHWLYSPRGPWPLRTLITIFLICRTTVLLLWRAITPNFASRKRVVIISVSHMDHMLNKYLVKLSYVGRTSRLVTLFVNSPNKCSVCVFFLKSGCLYQFTTKEMGE